jgi:hypothetical protein
MVPTKPFGISAGTPGVMVGGGARKAANTAASDGLSALQARLAGAKKNKGMKVPAKKGRQKQDFSASGTLPGQVVTSGQ